MRSTKWFLAVILVLAAVFAAAAAADRHGGRGEMHGKLLRARLVGSILSDPAIHGVNRGGLPWRGVGSASLDRKGRFELRIRDLVIPSLGNPGPVTSVNVSLYCAPEASDAVFTTGSTPLSRDGDARLRERVTLPSRCLAPVLLVHPNGIAAVYIAASGFTAG